MKNADRPAFPDPNRVEDPRSAEDLGLTKRERFAMAAMQGILSNPNVEVSDQAWPVWLARTSKFIAEDLLAELEKTEES